jgi:hypothetical protein
MKDVFMWIMIIFSTISIVHYVKCVSNPAGHHIFLDNLSSYKLRVLKYELYLSNIYAIIIVLGLVFMLYGGIDGMLFFLFPEKDIVKDYEEGTVTKHEISFITSLISLIFSVIIYSMSKIFVELKFNILYGFGKMDDLLRRGKNATKDEVFQMIKNMQDDIDGFDGFHGVKNSWTKSKVVGINELTIYYLNKIIK